VRPGGRTEDPLGVPDVSPDGRHAHRELVGDLFVVEALPKKRDDLSLSDCEAHLLSLNAEGRCKNIK
jgi:hypothetical protein